MTQTIIGIGLPTPTTTLHDDLAELLAAAERVVTVYSVVDLPGVPERAAFERLAAAVRKVRGRADEGDNGQPL
jgi:hypothetical protein